MFNEACFAMQPSMSVGKMPGVGKIILMLHVSLTLLGHLFSGVLNCPDH